MEADLEREDRQPLFSEQPQNSCKLKDDSTPTSFPQDDTDSVSVTFNAGKRPYRDSIFAVLFLGTILLTFGFGIVAFTRADLNLDSNLRLSKFNRNTSECEIVEQPRPLEETGDLESLALMISLPICALVLTFPVGVVFLWLLQRYTRGIVLLVVPVVTLIPLGQSVYWFTWCYGIDETCATEVSTSTQIFHAFYNPSISAFSLYQLWKGSFEIPIQLLKMATSALKENFLLLILHPVVFLGSTAIIGGPIFTFIYYAPYSGKIVPNFDVVNDPSKGCHQTIGHPCCGIESPNFCFMIAYFVLACFTYLWVFMAKNLLQRKSLYNTTLDFAVVAYYTIFGMTLIYLLLQSFIVYGVLEYFTNNFWLENKSIATMCFHRTFLDYDTFYML